MSGPTFEEVRRTIADGQEAAIACPLCGARIGLPCGYSGGKPWCHTARRERYENEVFTKRREAEDEAAQEERARAGLGAWSVRTPGAAVAAVAAALVAYLVGYDVGGRDAARAERAERAFFEACAKTCGPAGVGTALEFADLCTCGNARPTPQPSPRPGDP